MVKTGVEISTFFFFFSKKRLVEIVAIRGDLSCVFPSKTCLESAAAKKIGWTSDWKVHLFWFPLVYRTFLRGVPWLRTTFLAAVKGLDFVWGPSPLPPSLKKGEKKKKKDQRNTLKGVYSRREGGCKRFFEFFLCIVLLSGDKFGLFVEKGVHRLRSLDKQHTPKKFKVSPPSRQIWCCLMPKENRKRWASKAQPRVAQDVDL